MSGLIELVHKDIEEIPIDLINEDSFVIRTSYEDIEELAESIRSLGLFEPVILRRSNREKPYELLAGHRRLKACRMVGLKKVKAVVIDVNDKDAYLIAITENLQRKSLNPIEEAMAYYNYVHKKGWGGVTELAKNIGKSSAYVTMYIKLLELPLEVQEMIAKGELKPFVAAELEKVKDEKTLKKLVDEIKDKKMSMRELRNKIKKIKYDFEREENPNLKYYTVLKSMIAATRNCLIQYDISINKLEESSDAYKKALTYRFELHQLLDSMLNELSDVKKELYYEGLNP
ncbi:MAG: ParB/RepB/Spo0J family partition protein [Nitrososphaeria archaeon]